MRRCSVGLFVLLCGMAHAQEGVSSTATGVFTEEQVGRGEVAYNAHCAVCHGSDLLSTDREVPNLTSPFRWPGKTIADMFELVRDGMPPEEKHSLDDQVYLDIVTYILRFNKVPAGRQPLTPDIQLLKRIVIAPPPG